MTRIIGISGSLRKASFNTSLLRAAAGLMPEGAELSIVTLHGIPLYDGDVESSSGIPQPAADLKQLVANSDGVILATPEYNNSIPGVFKNAIDWMSRPPADIPKVFGGKPIAIIGASAGAFGTILSQNAWLPVLKTLGTRPWFGGRLLVPKAQNVFDPTGAITDESVKASLQKLLSGFVEFVRS